MSRVKQEDRPSSESGGSWHRVEEWTAKRSSLAAPSWEAVRLLKKRAEGAFALYKNRYLDLQQNWEQRLKPLCGELYSAEWGTFRPLRLSREEDWSDWLAWLLGTSTSGVLAQTLFETCMNGDLRSPKVCREEPKGQERKADIVVRWSQGRYTSIEVKIRDKNFEKTFDTCKLLEDWIKGVEWNHTILIPEESRADWRAVAKQHTKDIKEVLWIDVVRGLRKSLWRGQEPAVWLAWAWSFCRAVETGILNWQTPDLSKADVNQLAMVIRWVGFLATDPRET